VSDILDTVDQRIDWACAMSQELIPGHEFGFSVFDPVTQITRVTGRVIGPETVNVPSGTFTAIRIAYTMEKPDGKEMSHVLASRGENISGVSVRMSSCMPSAK
jgi:hypothetical protein